ncbi:MAG: DUF3047 domain-containing protein [Halofilum sp. (in: g-proteobacteria)]|nr:DUF3047 domain-containing protein [Halofilum sp. (in: g-proteobacteria)]
MRTRLAGWLLLAVLGPAAAAEVRVVGDWPGDLDGPWQRRDFAGVTRYSAAEGERPAVHAVAEASASALYRELEVDVTQTPWLQWSWRVDRLPAIAAPETAKAGDDYGARVYVVREGFFGKLSANALNYVWSQQQPVGSRWPNAFTGRATMWSVQQGADTTGEWITHTRDVRADWRTAFGGELERIHGVAIMTDADNSDSRAEARYGRIRFCATRDCNGQ